MTDYSLTQNRSASDMDGGGTDLQSGDTVVTNAFKLTLDIDCGFKKITVNNSGELQVDGHTLSVDDAADAGIDAQTGSKISSPNLSKSAVAVFFSSTGKGSFPLFPFSFKVLGTLSLPYCRVFGNKWCLKNSNYELEFPYGCAQIIRHSQSNLVRNEIQGHHSSIKEVGHKTPDFILTGLLFNDYIHLEDLIQTMLHSGESFSLVSERYHIEAVKLADFRPVPRSKELLNFTLSILEV